MFIPRYILDLVSFEPAATFTLSPEGVVHFRAKDESFHELVPGLSELLKVCAILTRDSGPSLHIESLPSPCDVLAGVSKMPVLREARGMRSIAVLAITPSAHQTQVIFSSLPNVIALAHPDGVLRAPIRSLETPYARSVDDWAAGS